MRAIGRDRLIYAGGTALVVLLSYLLTLPPTLTFWDAGEFAATAKILGIPHPPGTPVFVLIGHVFGAFPLPIEYGARLNLLTALATAIGGGLLFLVVDSIGTRIDRARGWELPAPLVHLAASGAVLLGMWGLTMWTNSTEAEVYGIAIVTIALVTFLVFWWADHLAEGKDWNLLLLVVFLMGFSIGNHLMALLVMPAVVAYALLVVWPTHRDYVLSLLAGAFGLYLVVMEGISIDAILAGTNPVNGAMMLVGLLVLGAGLWWMSRTGALLFFGAAVLLFAAGASVLLFLKIRAGLDPSINEANPETWRELLAVLARKQYDVRPMFPRSVSFLGHQVPLYFDYLFGRIGPFQSNVPAQFGAPGLSLVVFALAILGSVHHYRADRKTWVYFLLVYGITSLGLVLYLNFPLGNTQAPDVTGVPREVRERDYFFVVSFLFLALWAGLGLLAAVGETARRMARPLGAGARAGLAAGLLLVPAAVFAFNFEQADRRGNWIPRDFAWNLLQSVEPWGILITNGDNDTFPLWYLQEVEGVRNDVAVVNLALLNTLWYAEQLSDGPFTATNPPARVGPIPLAEAVPIEAGPRPTEAVLEYTGGPDDPLARIGYVIEEETSLEVAGIPVTLPAGSILRRQDVGVLQLVRRHLGRRPIYFSVTVPDDAKVGLFDHLLRQGISDRLIEPTAAEAARTGLPYLPMQPPERSWIDVDRTLALLTRVYEYRGLTDDAVYKDGTARALIGNYAATWLQLAAAQARRGETEAAIASLEAGHGLLGRAPDDESYLSSLINVYAVGGSYAALDSLLQSAEGRSGARLDDRWYKTAAYNAAVAGHFEVADRILEKYFRETPRAVEPDLWIEIGEMAVAAGDTSRAITFLSRAIRVDPDNRRAFLRHINLARATGNEILARTFLQQWVRMHPGDTTSARLYQGYLDTGVFPSELRWETIVGDSPPPAASGGAGEAPPGGE